LIRVPPKYLAGARISLPPIEGSEAGSERRTWTTNPSASLKRDGPDGTVIWTPGNIFQSDDRHSPT